MARFAQLLTPPSRTPTAVTSSGVAGAPVHRRRRGPSPGRARPARRRAQRLVHAIVTLKLAQRAVRTMTARSSRCSARRWTRPAGQPRAARPGTRHPAPPLDTRRLPRRRRRGRGAGRAPRSGRRPRRAVSGGDRSDCPTSSWPRRSRTSSSPHTRSRQGHGVRAGRHAARRDPRRRQRRCESRRPRAGGMRDRVTTLGGRLEIDSPDGDGTRVAASLPLSAG